MRGGGGGIRRERGVVLGRGGLVAQPREPTEDFFVGGGEEIRWDGVCGPGEAAVGLQAGREEVEVGGGFPAGGADEGVGGEVRAGGEVDGSLGETGDVGDVDAHGAGADQLEEVRWVVEDAEAGGDPEGADPGLELGGLRVGVVAVQLDDVVGEDAPKRVDDLAAEPGAVQEAADARVAVGGAPDAGAEEGQEARGDQLLEPLLQRGDVRRRHPDGAVAVLADDPVDLRARRGGRVDGVPGGFGAAEDGDAPAVLKELGFVLEKIAAVEERRVEGLLAGEVGQVGLRGDPGGDDEFARHDLLGGAVVLGAQQPGAIRTMFGRSHARVEPDAIAELEMLRKSLQVLLDDMAGDMLARLDAKRGGVHGKVAELVGAQHVVGLEAFVQPMLGPHAANGRGRLQKHHLAGRVDLEIGLDGREATPA